MAVATRLKEERIKRNIKQEELALAIDIHPKSLGRIERGERTPSVETALRLARYLECSVERLFSEIES